MDYDKNAKVTKMIGRKKSKIFVLNILPEVRL